MQENLDLTDRWRAVNTETHSVNRPGSVIKTDILPNDDNKVVTYKELLLS